MEMLCEVTLKHAEAFVFTFVILVLSVIYLCRILKGAVLK